MPSVCGRIGRALLTAGAWLAGVFAVFACAVVAVVLLVPDALGLLQKDAPNRQPLLRPIRWWQAVLVLAVIFGVPALILWIVAVVTSR